MADRTSLADDYAKAVVHSCKSVQPFSRNVADKELASGIAQFTRIDPKCNEVVPWSLHTFPENFMQIGSAVLPE